MREEPYLRTLDRAHNIAVLLGKASGGLCSIDIDSDGSIAPFLLLNPKLATTLRSRVSVAATYGFEFKGPSRVRPCSSGRMAAPGANGALTATAR
jgi:hypothetical protein